MQKNAFYVKAASHFHIFTFPRIAVSSIFAHNNYNIIHYIIIIMGILSTHMDVWKCGNVKKRRLKICKCQKFFVTLYAKCVQTVTETHLIVI